MIDDYVNIIILDSITTPHILAEALGAPRIQKPECDKVYYDTVSIGSGMSAYEANVITIATTATMAAARAMPFINNNSVIIINSVEEIRYQSSVAHQLAQATATYVDKHFPGAIVIQLTTLDARMNILNISDIKSKLAVADRFHEESICVASTNPTREECKPLATRIPKILQTHQINHRWFDGDNTIKSADHKRIKAAIDILNAVVELKISEYDEVIKPASHACVRIDEFLPTVRKAGVSYYSDNTIEQAMNDLVHIGVAIPVQMGDNDDYVTLVDKNANYNGLLFPTTSQETLFSYEIEDAVESLLQDGDLPHQEKFTSNFSHFPYPWHLELIRFCTRYNGRLYNFNANAITCRIDSGFSQPIGMCFYDAHICDTKPVTTTYYMASLVQQHDKDNIPSHISLDIMIREELHPCFN